MTSRLLFTYRKPFKINSLVAEGRFHFAAWRCTMWQQLVFLLIRYWCVCWLQQLTSGVYRQRCSAAAKAVALAAPQVAPQTVRSVCHIIFLSRLYYVLIGNSCYESTVFLRFFSCLFYCKQHDSFPCCKNQIKRLFFWIFYSLQVMFCSSSRHCFL